MKSQFGIQSEAVPLGPYLLDDYVLRDIPEIRSTVRIRPEKGEDFWIRYEDKNFVEKGFFLADSNFFSFFSFPLVTGHPADVLREPNSLVISQSAALTYFGNTDPVGEVVYIHGLYPAMVTGVMEDFPSNSHFQASMIANFELSRSYLPPYMFDNWGSLSCHYYMKLADNANPDVVSDKIMLLLEEIIPHMTDHLSIFIQPLLDVRLHSANVAWDIGSQGSNIASLKSSFWARILNLRIRQVLIIFQFACAIVLITLSFSINRQINFLFTKDYGYEAAGLLVVSNPDDENRYMRFSRLKNHLEPFHEVHLVAAGENIPSNRHGNFTYIQMTESDYEVQTGNMNVSHDYLVSVSNVRFLRYACFENSHLQE